MKLLDPYRGTLLRLAVINTLLLGVVAVVLVLFDVSVGFGSEREAAVVDGFGSASGGAGLRRVAAEDRQFVMAAAQLAWEQVRVAMLAAERADSEPLRTFAREVAARQTLARNDIESLAARKGILLPTGETASPAAGALASTATGRFDDAFMDWAATTQAATVRLFREAAHGAVDPELRNFAARLLPHLEAEHQRALRLKRVLF